MDGFTGVINIGGEIFKDELKQNYPNPFISTTTIPFTITNTTQVSLIVLDLNGRTVQVLINKSVSPGNHEIQMNRENLPSGIYIVRLSTPYFSETIKMRVQ
jgi:hypothetical protein